MKEILSLIRGPLPAQEQPIWWKLKSLQMVYQLYVLHLGNIGLTLGAYSFFSNFSAGASDFLVGSELSFLPVLKQLNIFFYKILIIKMVPNYCLRNKINQLQI